MAIKFREDRQKWQADCRAWGKGRPLFRTKREAEQFEHESRVGITGAVEKSIALSAAFDSYAEDVTRNKTSETTRLNEERYFNLKFHFMSGRGIKCVGQVEARDLQAFQQWLLKAHDGVKGPWNKSTVNRAFHTYKHFYATMVKWKIRSTNPCTGLKMLSEDEVTIQTVEPEAFNTALEGSAWFGPVLEFIHEVGCRPSSVERLTWLDVDFKKREFILTSRKGREAQLRRTPHAMTESIFALLIRARNEWPIGSAVFRNQSGEPITASWISHKGRKVFKGRVAGGAMKALRHTLASDLTAAGVPTEVVRQALDHSNIRTTQRYARSIKGSVVADAIERVRKVGICLAPNGTNSEESVALSAKEEIG